MEDKEKYMIIDEFKQERQRKPESIKNILVLALSTMHVDKDGKMTASKAECRIEGRGLVNEVYHYQLEPVPIMLTRYLKNKGEQIDEVIMICSKEVCDKRRGISLEKYPGAAKEENINLKSGSEDDLGVSARDYFVHCLKKILMKGNDQAGRSGYSPYFFEVDYENADNEEEQSRLIGKIISEIRKRNEENKKIEIFIDTHGGFRTYQDVVNSVLSLLRFEGIHINPENIFTVNYANSTGEVVSSGFSLKVHDFVSGMTELMNYGRTDTLKIFLDSINADKRDMEILEIVSGISEGIQFCNVSEFENRIDELKDLMNANKAPDYNDKDDNRNEFLNIFKENIRNNYSGLLKNNRTVTDEISWCLEKGYYQQVLTLIEARVPRYLNCRGIFRYDNGIQNVAADKKADFELNNYIFNNYVTNVVPAASRLDIFDAQKPKVTIFDVTDSKLNKLKTKINIKGADAKDFMRLHCGFKEIRNCSNHASDQLPNGSLSIPRVSFEKKVGDYLDIIIRMEADPQKNYIELCFAPVYVVLCTSKTKDKWNSNLLSNINTQVGQSVDPERVGPKSFSANDTNDILNKAQKTAQGILYLKPINAVLDVEKHVDLLDADYKLFWNTVAGKLSEKKIPVFSVVYKLITKDENGKPLNKKKWKNEYSKLSPWETLSV